MGDYRGEEESDIFDSCFKFDIILSILVDKVLLIDLSEVVCLSQLSINQTSKRLYEVTYKRLPFKETSMIDTFVYIKPVQVEVCLYDIINHRIADIQQKIGDVISRAWHSSISSNRLEIVTKKEFSDCSLISSHRSCIDSFCSFGEYIAAARNSCFEIIIFFSYRFEKQELIADFIFNNLPRQLKVDSPLILFFSQHIIPFQSFTNKKLGLERRSKHVDRDIVVLKSVDQLGRKRAVTYDEQTKELGYRNFIHRHISLFDQQISIGQ